MEMLPEMGLLQKLQCLWPDDIRQAFGKDETLRRRCEQAYTMESYHFLSSLINLATNLKETPEDQVDLIQRLYFGDNAPFQINLDYQLEQAVLQNIYATTDMSREQYVVIFIDAGNEIAMLLFQS